MTMTSKRSLTRGRRTARRRRRPTRTRRGDRRSRRTRPRGRDAFAVLLIHRHLLVHVVQLALRELRADRVQQALERAVVLLQDRVTDDRRDVVGELQVLVVVEEDEVLRDDARVTREEEPDVDLLPVERSDGQRSARLERLEVLEGEAVCILQAERAER